MLYKRREEVGRLKSSWAQLVQRAVVTPKPFFAPNDGQLFINTDHVLKYNLENDSTRKFTYGLNVSKNDHYWVWLKMKKDHSHYLYYRWYRIGGLDLNKGENYFTLHLTQKDIIPGKIFFSSNEKVNPSFMNEIEGEFKEKDIQIRNEKVVEY